MFKARSHETHWNNHVPVLQKSKKDRFKIALIGDSMLERFRTTGKGLSVSTEKQFLNLGVGGDKITNVLYRINEGLLQEMKPHKNIEKILIHIGGNDVRKGQMRDEQYGEYELLLKKVKENFPNAQIYGSALFFRKDCSKSKIRLINGRLKAIADRNGVQWINAPKMPEEGGFEEDGHLDLEGYTIWNNHLRMHL